MSAKTMSSLSYHTHVIAMPLSFPRDNNCLDYLPWLQAAARWVYITALANAVRHPHILHARQGSSGDLRFHGPSPVPCIAYHGWTGEQGCRRFQQYKGREAGNTNMQVVSLMPIASGKSCVRMGSIRSSYYHYRLTTDVQYGQKLFVGV